MIYFRIFNVTQDYVQYMAREDAVRPNVSYCSGDNKTYITAFEGTVGALEIKGASNISAETCMYSAWYNSATDVTTSATWSVVSGSQYATINPSSGLITILNVANESDVTIQASYSGLTATKEITLTYVNGSSSETTTEAIVDAEGNVTTIVTTVTTNEDGSSSEVIESVVVDESGNTIGSTSSNKEINSDGSYEGTTINYDSEGNPINGDNVTGDTDGNVSTQNVKYDESGNTVVTGYDIDTSGNPDGAKEFRADGVNTEYYALDVTQGFVMDIHFTIDFTNQPPNQNDNHHNIINSKRATPEPWYGFQVRQSSTNKYIQLGTQFSTGSNANTTITTTNANKYNGSSNIYEYNLHIVYDPTASTNNFTCDELIGDAFHYTSNNTFPDIEDLKYIKTTIGCALDANGDPFRLSNINVFNFSIRKLSNISDPVIGCDGREVTITCETVGADIYYRFNNVGLYTKYTTPIAITADTLVEAYSTYRGRVSTVVSQNCEYSPVHHYENDYLTLRVRTNGKIYWHSNGSGQAKTIDYSVNGGTWSSITATDTSTYIDVVANDVVRFRGSNTSYAKDKSNYSGFGQGEHGTSGQETYDADAADVDVEGNIMSLIYGDNFIGQTTFSSGTYNFCSIFKKLKVVSAENLVLPALTLRDYCYRAMFSWCTMLTIAPQLPATTLAKGVYWYMFEKCAITEAPELLAEHLVAECYGSMFTGCTHLNYIKCMAIDGFGTSNCKQNWVQGVACCCKHLVKRQ